jgi:hypothetical protein
LAGHGGSRPVYGDAVGRGGEPRPLKTRAALGTSFGVPVFRERVRPQDRGRHSWPGTELPTLASEPSIGPHRALKVSGKPGLVEAFLKRWFALVPGSQVQEAEGERVMVAIASGQSGQVAQQRDRKVVKAPQGLRPTAA